MKNTENEFSGLLRSIKETAYQLGFPTTATFCRYFKRATGIYPQEYKDSIVAP